MKKKKILVLHGPNLNLLGERQPEIYGYKTLKEIQAELRKLARILDVSLVFFQSNHEGALIDKIHAYRKKIDGMVINPGAFTHYSWALRDAVLSVNIPTVEVHLSSPQRREKFRRVSVLQGVRMAEVSGLGWKSYLEGLRRLVRRTVGDLADE